MQVTDAKVVLVTGGTSGIGYVTSYYLARKEGYKVYATYRETSVTNELDKAIQELKGKLVKICMDVTNEKSVQEAVQAIIVKEKKIDVLINNAGYCIAGNYESCTLKQQKKLFKTNYFGAVNVCQAVLPY